MLRRFLERSPVLDRRQFCCLAFLLVVATGCSDGRPKRVPVSGKVLIDGEPLKFGAVMFVPDTGRASSGTLNADGHFVLTCYSDNDGALIGTHKVQVFGQETINNTTARIHAPKKYGDLKNSGLSQEISGPTDSVVIKLTWKGNVPDKPYTETSGPSGVEMPRWSAGKPK